MRRPALVAVVALAVAAVAAPVRTAAAPPAAIVAFGDAAAFGGDVPDDAVDAATTARADGLLVATDDGRVVAFGSAVERGSIGQPLAAAVVDIEASPTDLGYWLVAADGGVFAFGDAAFFGSTGGMVLNQPIVAASATPTGRGYWLVAADGGVFTFGDAPFFGSTGDMALNQPIVAVAATPTARGYWLVARDGGVFTFGDAPFFGSTGDIALNQPIVAAAATATGGGYWLAARDGGVFDFGDATFHGSGAERLPSDADAVAFEPSRAGYWLVTVPGAVRVALAGDVHGERHIGDQVRAGQDVLDGVAGVLAAADLAAVNLETPVGRPGVPQPKQYVFLAPPELLSALEGGGVDVVSLANNHALDHGASTLLETIDLARAAGLVVVGAGANAAEAYAPRVVEVRGRRVAFVGLSMVVPPGWAATATRPGVASAYDRPRSLQAVRAAAASADMVVVLVHWGVELARCPPGDVVRLADALHAAGAAVVAGHHPHVLQGVDARRDRVTAYSLGNFVWYHDEPPSDLTGVLDVVVDRNGVATTFHPGRVGADGRPRLLAGGEADAVRAAVMGGPCWAS